MPLQDHQLAAGVRIQLWINDAVEEILRHENSDRFLGWARNHFSRYVDEAIVPEINQESARAVGVHLGRALWNVVPLPSNQFRPQPLPEPGRNDPCFCGSGDKYKRCCGQVSAPAIPASIEFLHYVLRHFEQEQILSLLAAKQIPVSAVVDLADAYLEDDLPERAVPLLEGLLESKAKRDDPEMIRAMFLLCDGYEVLDAPERKLDFLKQMTREKTAMSFRSNAWQRLATVYADAGNWEKAWDAVHHAKQDDPRDDGIGVLEVHLLLSYGNAEEAQARARAWLQGTRSVPPAVSENGIAFMERVALNPEGALDELDEQIAEEDQELSYELVPWLEEVAARPLPHYRLVAHAGDPAPASSNPASDTSSNVKSENSGKESAFTLSSPDSVATVEEQWKDYFPGENATSTLDPGAWEVDPWDEGVRNNWISFLESHPQTYDSVRILDDVSSALLELDYIADDEGDEEYFDEQLEAVLQRSRAIIKQALSVSPDATLPWANPANRPAVRTFARLAGIAIRRKDWSAAQVYAMELLALNPTDDHGLRMFVADSYVSAGANEAMLELVRRFPQDDHASLRYGEGLALFRLGRTEEAEAALQRAVRACPRVAQYLLTDEAELKLSSFEFSSDEDEDAWYYQNRMRSLWNETPGALATLEKITSQSELAK